MKILCYLGFHKWRFTNEFIPDFYAPIITKWTFKSICLKCGKTEEVVDEFDPITGAPVDEDNC